MESGRVPSTPPIFETPDAKASGVFVLPLENMFVAISGKCFASVLVEYGRRKAEIGVVACRVSPQGRG